MNAQNEKNVCRAFVSYSWDTEEHKRWVLDFATQLRSHGVDVWIDQMHLRLGSRAPQFMEHAVRESDRVLVVCTENYKKRFDARLGGTGYEGHIITGEIVNEVGPNKFIPILRSGEWETAMPTALSGLYGVDLRNDSLDEFRKLVKELHGVSQIQPLGTKPEWARDDGDRSPAIVTSDLRNDDDKYLKL